MIDHYSKINQVVENAPRDGIWVKNGMFVHVQEKVSKELEHTIVNCDREISSVPIHCLNPL